MENNKTLRVTKICQGEYWITGTRYFIMKHDSGDWFLMLSDTIENAKKGLTGGRDGFIDWHKTLRQAKEMAYNFLSNNN